ncbi:NAD(P)-binding domain-containing protein [Penaeicola halotolerans]|uniref:NAD(P)-binding domain-containing protein n=1 Tax=Penaeicola halotolerans TaxID=2793196 RepID=UPI001CF8D208|nr:NAD(P)-binding domain-containing protein [Penaeicola halotolerans]
MKQIGIIGLGWYGLPLAKHLSQNGYEVKGTVTSAEKQTQLLADGIETVLLKMVPHPEGVAFHSVFQCETIIINIPPRSRTATETFYPEQMKYLRQLLENGQAKHVIFVSATSVYPDAGQVATESDPLSLDNTGNEPMLQAEQIISSSESYQTTILRFGGLLGYDRIPGKYFAGKEVQNTHLKVNYIHRDDAVAFTEWVIKHNYWAEVVNVVSPLTRTRAEVYLHNATNFDFAAPIIKSGGNELGKYISPEKIKLLDNFQFKYPDPLHFYFEPKN